MLKKRSILSWLLAFCLCFSMAVPAFAAETDDLELTLLSDTEAVLTVGDDTVTVQAYDDMTIDSEAVTEFYKRAQMIKAEEEAAAIADEDTPQVDAFEYTLLTDDVVYFYEESADGVYKNLYVSKPVIEETAEDGIAPMAALPDGIGGRIYFNNTSNTYMSGKIQTPTKEQVAGINNTGKICNYLYTGFTGKMTSGSNIESDIGLQYQQKDNNGGWNHYFYINIGSQKITIYDPIKERPEVSGNNYFLTSDSTHTRTIHFTTYSKFYDSERSVNTIRSKMEGYARYNNKEGNGTPDAYWLISVKEYVGTVSSISRWKVLNTITSETASGLKSWCKFSNLTINGSAIARSIVSAADQDYATVNPSYSGNNLSTVTINVSK